MEKYTARKPFRYGDKVYLTGQPVPVLEEDVRMLQGQGKIGGRLMETASVKPPERAVKPKAEPKHIGGGWYEIEGKKVRKKDLKDGD